MKISPMFNSNAHKESSGSNGGDIGGVKKTLSAFIICFTLFALFLLLNQHGMGQHAVLVRRKLRQKKDNGPLHPKFFGTSTLVPNRTVIGAIIMSDTGDSNLEMTTTWKDGDATSRVASAAEMAAIRARHAREMYNSLPFPTIEWPSVFTKACPQFRQGHRTERGLAFAHYQIWLDYIFFDDDVLQALQRKEVKGMYTSTAWTSTGAVYAAAQNGTLYKNGVPFLDDDILVVFEDDADIAVVDHNTSLVEELTAMTTDILYLGWCDGRAARPVPLCAHAYAITRRGVRKAVQHFEPCGLALDEQLVIMGKNKWLTYRTVHAWSYKNKFNSNYPKPHDQTFGMFHQKRMGSFNGH